ncbi:DUF916 and DUF3324 domain-containing protein [Streptococcaceae bacterium ESL0687]|nr:DUF916 and DUF3324 domain-containing protein [Streptococcaceae bacterium ESL0687]
MKKRIMLLAIFIFSIIVSPLTSLAETAENNVGFTINAVIPSNQVDREQSYFDLRMTPGQEQEIVVQIINTSTEESKFKVNVNQAYTNKSGFIDYADSTVTPDSSMVYKISDIASYEHEVTVAANTTLNLPITLKMPAEQYDGTILAGIQVIKEKTEAEEEESKGGITNQYGYILGLKLTETDTEIKRELNLLSVHAADSFNKTSVVAQLQNPTMDPYGHLKYQAKVTNKKDGSIAKEVSYDNNMQIAPNSTYDFAIDWDGKALVAGDYNLDLVVSDDRGNEWKFNKDFTITKQEAKKINDKVIIKGKQENPYIKYFLILLALVVILTIIMFVIKKRNKDKEEDEEK